MARTTSKRSARGKKSSGGMKDLWAQAKDQAKEGNFGEAVPVEPGNFIMQLVGAEIADINDCKTLITKWCVTDEDDSGTICTSFQKLETVDNMVWAQRLMISLGFDIDAIDPDEDDDILEAFNEAIEDGTAAKIQVVEKGGYINMKIGKAVQLDEDELFDPKEVLGTKKSKGRGSDKADSKKSRSGRKAKAKLTVEDVEDEISEMSKVELKEWIAEKELDVKVGRKDDEDTIIDAILDLVETL